MSNPKNPDPDKGKPAAAAPATKAAPAKKPPAKKKAAAKPAGDFTATSWAHALLGRLGAPVTAQNVQAIVAWEASEGGHWHNTAYYNPLNTTQNAAGATSMNGVGVKAYTSWQQGLDATVQTLENGNYGSILHALRAGGSASTVAQAVVNSPWGTHNINVGGNYTGYGTGNVTVHTNGNVTSDSLGTPGDVNKYLDNNPDVAAQYGYLAAYLNDPTIGPILKQAAAEGRGSNWLLGQLEKTSWWKTTAQTAREMQALQRTDPATYRQKYQGMLAQVSTLATSLGIQIPKNRLGQLATTALWSGWSNLQIQNAVGAEFHYNPTAAYKGSAGADVQRFKQLAAQYLTPLSNGTLGTWVQQALQGKVNPDDFTGYLAEQAKTLFPWMSKAIDAGVSPTTYLDSYKQAAAQTLELDPNAVNFMDPKWRSLFETVDPKTHERTERGLANALTMMRTDPRYGYDQTQGAKQEGAGLAANLAQMFGFTGTGSSIGAGVNQPTA